MGTSIITLVLVLGSTVVTLAMTGVILWLVYAKVVAPLLKAEQQKARLLATGHQAQARVLSLQETGMLVNHRPQVRIVLEVARPGQLPYQAELTTVISMLAIPRVQPGNVVWVRCDPANPSLVAIEGLG
jgi:hypothetical protein